MDIASLVTSKRNPKIPAIAPGDTVRVHSKIVEGGKERIQVLQGVVIRIKQGGNGASFTVRHVAYGIGVERTFPFYSPRVEKVEIVRHGKVRRAKLYYLRQRSGKSARIKERRVDKEKEQALALVQEEQEEIEEAVAEVPEQPQDEIEAQASEEAVAEITEQPQDEVETQTPEETKETETVAEAAPEPVQEEVPEEIKDQVPEEVKDQLPEEVEDKLPAETQEQAQAEKPEEEKQE